MQKKDEAYYRNMGFLCGLEIHQRLATQEKLFCSCPATPNEDNDRTIGKISRYQRAIAGELGQIDKSAEFEELRERKFTYDVHDKHTCLVELDEEPPHAINEEALRISLAFAASMKMNIISELQPMRKGVVDGSDPSAFQRTILIGIDGEINVKGTKINIPSLFLEEESSSIVLAKEGEIMYDTERLGIPLVEIDTDPHIATPEMAKEVALYIGTLIRVSGKVQRGIGSIRQDVNVSITGGNRVEIKGFQELENMDKFIENEVVRQHRLLEIKDKLVKAKAFVEKPKELSEIFKKSDVKIVKNHLDKDGSVLGFRLKGFKSIIGEEINPDRRLGSEISDYAKMAKVNGIIHSDENLQSYGFTEHEIHEINSKLSIGESDAFVLVAGSKENARKAADLAVERAKYALVGVPLETRGVGNTEYFTTKFLRPLPSGSRMYPETDARPIFITLDHLQSAEEGMPNVEMERGRLLGMLGNAITAEQLLLSPKLHLFKAIVHATGADPNLVANILLQKFTELRRSGFDVDSIPQEKLIELFDAYNKNYITKQAIDEILKAMAKDKEAIGEIMEKKGLMRITGKELQKLIKTMKKESASATDNELRNIIMSKYRLNVDGTEMNEVLQKK